MVEFFRLTIKLKTVPSVVDDQLEDRTIMVERQKDALNAMLVSGYEIIHTTEIEDLRGCYLLFVLYKKPDKREQGESA